MKDHKKQMLSSENYIFAISNKAFVFVTNQSTKWIPQFQKNFLNWKAHDTQLLLCKLLNPSKLPEDTFYSGKMAEKQEQQNPQAPKEEYLT